MAIRTSRAPRRPLRSLRSIGFSLVELVVALLFVSILMAGMAKVFQASLNTFYAAGESLASHRRNLMAGEMLYDDLNNAGMYLVDLMAAPTFSAGNPPFLIRPNMLPLNLGIADPTILAVQKTVPYDELTFYMDQPLPFEGQNANSILSASQIMAAGGTVGPPTLTINFKAIGQAPQVKPGMIVVFKDSFQPYMIDTVNLTGPTSVLVTTKDASQDLSGAPTGTNITSNFAHFGGAQVAIVLRGQQVRYTVVLKNFDPANPAANIPCLVRQQGVYSAAGFVPDPLLESVIAENVSAFKVYLSMRPSDPGQVATPGAVWGGYGDATTDWNSGTGILSVLDTQLAATGRAGFKSVRNTTNLNWFRDIPVAVRLDITTRSTNARTEYQNIPNPTTRAFKDTTQTLVMVPRHFGLSLN